MWGRVSVSANELYPLTNHGLTGPVLRMGFAGKDELYRMLRIGQQTEQALGIVQQQVRSFVGGEAASKTESQYVGARRCSALAIASDDAPEARVNCLDKRSRV